MSTFFSAHGIPECDGFEQMKVLINEHLGNSSNDKFVLNDDWSELVDVEEAEIIEVLFLYLRFSVNH
jgi:hypothetical protein